jgi:hypothetical protein
MKVLCRRFFGIGLGIALICSMAMAGGDLPKRVKRESKPVQIKVVPVGPTQEMIDQARLDVERSAAVQQVLAGKQYRLLDISYIDNTDKSRGELQLPTRYKAVFYDYTNDRVFVAEGSFDGSETVTVHEEFYQPVPSQEEFDAALRVLQKSGNFADSLKRESLKPFRPMPPVTVLDGTTERILNIGLSAQDSDSQNQIVGVSIKRGVVVLYPNNAPPMATAAPDACGPAFSNGSGGGAGQYQLTVTQGQTTLWEMLVVRPGASVGTNGSGIQVDNVKYKGKMVMKRGHVPVLDVQYIPQTCGPYRDWQDEEGMFNAPTTGATDPAPGIRVLGVGQVATTILESGVDAGNFNGVAIYTQNNETVMVTEMNAGWYRYIMEWRFDNNGTIRPRFGFGATSDNCTCNIHHHHVYWRFDFDVVQANNRVYQVERGRRFLQPITTEISRAKSIQTNRSLMVQNSAGDEAYMVVPNISDGKVDTFGVNDFWVLRYKTGASPTASEIDDGRVCCSVNSEFLGNNWVNGESVVDQDVVVWYGAHFMHTDGANLLDPDRSGLIISGSHVVGPDLLPIRW